MGENTSSAPDGAPEPVLLEDVRLRCLRCGYEGPAEPLAPGKAWLEGVLWIAFVLPGFLYSMWRLFGRRYLCPLCKSADGEVSIPTARRVAMALRAVLLILFVLAVAGLAVVWNFPRRG